MSTVLKVVPAVSEDVSLPDSSVFREPGFHFEPKSLSIDRGVKIGRWLWAVHQLSKMGESVQFWIGDAIHYGEHEYGEKYAQAEAEIDLDRDTLENYVYVAQNVDSTLRNVLSFSHHKAVAPLRPHEQKKWLAEALAEGWSYRELRRKIEETKRDPVISANTPKTDYLDPQFKRYLIDLENSLITQLGLCPYDPFRREIENFIRKVRYARNRSIDGDLAAVKEQVDQGCATVEEVEEEVTLSRSEIKRFFISMVGSEPCGKPQGKHGRIYYSEQAPTGDYEWRPIGLQTEMARGGRSFGIYRIDSPSGDDFRLPQNGSRYDSGESE